VSWYYLTYWLGRLTLVMYGKECQFCTTFTITSLVLLHYYSSFREPLFHLLKLREPLASSWGVTDVILCDYVPYIACLYRVKCVSENLVCRAQ